MLKTSNNKEFFRQSFEKQELKILNLEGIVFEECEFISCDFTSTTFSQCKFLDCSFNNCNLSLIKVPDSRFIDVAFLNCKLIGVNWADAYWPSFKFESEIRFTKSILTDSSFFGLTLNELKIDECKLHEVDFREADLQNSSLTYCDFLNSVFAHTNLKNVDFTESCNYKIDIFNNNISQAIFTRSEVIGLLDSLDIELVD